jgi:uncharacterized membrane protein
MDWKMWALAAAVIFIVDFLWLSVIGGYYGGVVRVIQGGRAFEPRLWAGAVVYAALAYLLIQERAVGSAFRVGMATYAIYDFTVLSLFKDYPIGLAVADTLWGGALFATARVILNKIGPI